MGFLSFFKKHHLFEPEEISEPINITELDKSFRLLESITTDVAQAATEAAKILKKKTSNRPDPQPDALTKILRIKYGANPDRETACFAAINGSSDAVAFIDKNGDVFFCNDQFVKEFKYLCYRQIINRNIKEVLPDFARCNEMWDAVQDNESWTKRCTKLNKSVTVVPMMEGQPHPLYYICTFKNIRAAKKRINRSRPIRK